QREPVVGAETLVGAVALVATPLDPRGQVRVAGELWQARSESLARPGEQVVIRSVEPDLTLVVTPGPGKSPHDTHAVARLHEAVVGDPLEWDSPLFRTAVSQFEQALGQADVSAS